MEAVEEYDLEDNFSRTKAGGGKINRIETKKDIPGCWVVIFNEKESKFI